MKGSVFTSQVTSVCLIFFALIFFSVKNVHAQPDGASLFKAQCAQCHSVGSNKVIGPGLKDVHTRRNEEWLLKWTKNSQGLSNRVMLMLLSFTTSTIRQRCHHLHCQMMRSNRFLLTSKPRVKKWLLLLRQELRVLLQLKLKSLGSHGCLP
ncbi:MAG: c-type cytochrome [Bacteroidetes bacterium]|nr:c-type cytochrome [Bacteroidota bacterium]